MRQRPATGPLILTTDGPQSKYVGKIAASTMFIAVGNVVNAARKGTVIKGRTECARQGFLEGDVQDLLRLVSG